MFARLCSFAALAAVAMSVPALAHAADFDVKAATDAYLATVTGAARAKSDAYFEGGYWLILWDALATIAVCFLLLFTRASAGLRNVAERLARWRWLQTFIYAALFILVLSILTFPLTIYEGFYREHAYGLSNMSLPAWLGDLAKGTGIAVVAGGLGLTAGYAAIRRVPKSWPVWAMIIVAAFLIIGSLLGPVFIEPMFNTYKPMNDGPVKDGILSLARANGVPATQVFQVDASRQSDRVSANVAGFLGTTRIALNDNLLRRASPAEIKAVMAHELGHYVLNHIVKSVVYLTLLFGVGFFFSNLGFAALYRVFGANWGVRDIGDSAGLPLLLIFFTLFGLVATPIQNSIVREDEVQADIFGLNAAREPDAFATAILKLAEYRKLDPTPLEEIVFYDHPSGRSRVAMAMQWKSEHLNELPPAPAPVAPAPEPIKPAPPVP